MLGDEVKAVREKLPDRRRLRRLFDFLSVEYPKCIEVVVPMSAITPSVVGTRMWCLFFVTLDLVFSAIYGHVSQPSDLLFCLNLYVSNPKWNMPSLLIIFLLYRLLIR